VSPIASLVEAVVIFRHLSLTQTRRQVKKHRWQITAASLLLLRGVVGDEDNGLMTELLRGTYLDREKGQELLATANENQEPESLRTDGMGQNSSPVFVPNPMLRRRTSQLEANAASSEPITSQPRESRILNSAFGANALAHREWRIDLVTWLSVTAIALK
jgi:hypothetical protein